MATTEEFRAVITAEDRTSAVLRGIGASLRGLAGSSGIGRLAGATAQLVGTMGSLASGAAGVALSLAGIGGAASAAGLTGLAVNAASSAAQLKALSEASGVPIARLEILADTARRAGVSQDDLAGGLGTLNERLREAGRGGSAELRQVMSALHVSLRDTNGQVRNAVDVLPNFANAFQRIQDPALRARLATALFGDAGARLLPILTDGAAGLRAGERLFGRYGVSVAASAEELAMANTQFKDLRDVMVGFAASVSTAIGTQLAPILGPIAQSLADWVAANRELIATDIAAYIREAATSAEAFFAEKGLLERLRDVTAGIRDVVRSLGGMRTIMIGFAALVAAPFVSALINVATTFGLVAAVIARLGLALLTSPIGWFLGLVAALAYAGYHLWRNWDEVAGFFRGLWARVVNAWGPQVTEMVQVIGSVGAALVTPLMAAWEPVARFFSGLWDSISQVFTDAWEKIRPIVEALRDAARLLNGSGTGPNASSNPAMNAPAQAERAGRMGARAQFIPGYNDLDVKPRLPESPYLYIGRTATEGRVQVDVNINGAPAGTRVEATSEGALVARPNVDLGLNLRGRLQ